jgi:PHP family Zn ribbon phosphoesterase
MLMRFFCDLHIHSKYARATSKAMDIENLSKYGKMKGLNLIGTGDFTHPKWLEELKEKLKPIENSGLYFHNEMKFMLTTEVSTVYNQDGKTRKVHHVIHAPSLVNSSLI